MAITSYLPDGRQMVWDDDAGEYRDATTNQIVMNDQGGILTQQQVLGMYAQPASQYSNIDPLLAQAALSSGYTNLQAGGGYTTPGMVNLLYGTSPEGNFEAAAQSGQYDPGTSDQRALLAAASIFGGAALAPASGAGVAGAEAAAAPTMSTVGGTAGGEFGLGAASYGTGASVPAMTQFGTGLGAYSVPTATLPGMAAGGLAATNTVAPQVETGSWTGGAQPVGDGTYMVNPQQGGPIQTLPDMALGHGVQAGPGAVDLTAGGIGPGAGAAGAAGAVGAAGAGALGGSAAGGAAGGLGAGSAALGGTEAMAAGALGGEALGGGGGYSGSPTGGGSGFGGALAPYDDWWRYLLPGVPGLVGALGAGSIAEDMEDLSHSYQQMGAPYRSRLESLYTPQGIQAYMQSPEVQVPVQQGTDILARSLSTQGNPAGSGNALQQLQNYSTNQLYSRLGQERDRLGGFGGLTAYNQAAPQAATNAMAMTNNMYGNLGGAAADIFNPQRRYTLEDFSRMFA